MTPLTELLRPLLLAVAALVLACTGGVELAPRSSPGGTTAVSAVVTAASPAARRAVPPARTDASAPAQLLRVSLAAASSTSGAGTGLPPGTGLELAQHLTATPQTRPPTGPAVSPHDGLPEGRAPPLTTGT